MARFGGPTDPQGLGVLSSPRTGHPEAGETSLYRSAKGNLAPGRRFLKPWRPSPNDKADFPPDAGKQGCPQSRQSTALNNYFLGRKEKKKETVPSPASDLHPKSSPRRVDFSLLISSWARVGVLGPRTFILAPASSPHPPGPPKGRRGLAEGAARDPERKGPSLGPNAGGVSLDRRRLGTTAGTGDKVTYQSRFGARADTPLPTGNAELFKRPYRLLYLSRRKASCRETKDVPYLEIQGHSSPHTTEGLHRRRPIRAQGHMYTAEGTPACVPRTALEGKSGEEGKGNFTG